MCARAIHVRLCRFVIRHRQKISGKDVKWENVFYIYRDGVAAEVVVRGLTKNPFCVCAGNCAGVHAWPHYVARVSGVYLSDAIV